jgi:hypothetical protein
MSFQFTVPVSSNTFRNSIIPGISCIDTGSLNSADISSVIVFRLFVVFSRLTADSTDLIPFTDEHMSGILISSLDVSLVVAV